MFELVTPELLVQNSLAPLAFACAELEFCETRCGKTKKKPKIRWDESKSSNYAQYIPTNREIAQTYSYENHPWEVQARTLGSAYRADCLR